MTDSPTEEERLPTKHGEKIAELVDLGGAVARIERTMYVGRGLTELTLMVPADVRQPSQSARVQLSREQLDKLMERLAWPTK